MSAKPHEVNAKINDAFQEMAETFREKSTEYGESAVITIGKALQIIFSDGLILAKQEDFQRFFLLTMVLLKAIRYSQNLCGGGHEDSALDMAVYAAMLLGHDRAAKNAGKVTIGQYEAETETAMDTEI